MDKIPWSRLKLPNKHVKLKVTRSRQVARNTEFLFKNSPSSRVFSKLNGVHQMKGNYSMRLAKHGCANHPFYHIVVAKHMDPRSAEIEQLGTFDAMPNSNNEKLCSLNFERIKYHLAHGAHPSKPVRRLLGLSGFLPLDPTLLLFAENLRRRRAIEEQIKLNESSERNEVEYEEDDEGE